MLAMLFLRRASPLGTALTFLLALFFTLMLASPARADTAPIDVYARPHTSLDGTWHIIVDPYQNGYYDYRYHPLDENPHDTKGYFHDYKAADKSALVEYNFDTSPTLKVPGDWNSQDRQFLYYEGTVWYRRTFDAPAVTAGQRVHLYFAAANYEADAYLNGRLLGRHVGGFTPFAYDITDRLKPTGNSLVVRVDHTRHVDAVPTVNTDWWNYGGITRDVLLVTTPATFIHDYHIQLAKGSLDRIAGTVQLAGAQKPARVTLTIPAAHLTATAETNADGLAAFDLPAPNLHLWSPDDPHLYDVTLSTDTGDTLTDRIGFRSIEVRGTDILLNGHPIFLRGVALHEEDPLRGGRVTTAGEDRMLLGWAKELGCNFLRLAHYPHNEFMARTADEMGLLLWEEVPVYWTIEFSNPATLANARAQLTDLITRDRNRASVIVWSVANETPVNDARTKFLKNLVDLARSLDDARLVSAAMEVTTDPADPNHKIVNDPFGAYTDLLSFNEYFGWYVGLPDDIAKVRWTFGYNKPVFISEFGAGALAGFHADKLTRWSEEWQADVYEKQLAMLSKIPQWRGASPWILCDFRSPRRSLPVIQDGWNRKGLIGQNGQKKEAFYVLQKFYRQKAAEAEKQ